MPTLLGAHLLQPWDALDANVQKNLEEWQPPVCVVFMDNVFTGDLYSRLQYSTHPPSTDPNAPPPTPTYESITTLMDSDTGYYRNKDAVKGEMDGNNIRNHILPFTTHSALANTKLVGRIYIHDDVVKAHIEIDPVKTAEFHHWLVTAAREHLDALADRVNYWVIVNEILGGNRGNLRQLGQYEKNRMALAGTEYGCGLYAFANANPPLLGNPHGGKQLYDATMTTALPHELAHWRDTHEHGLATVLAEANRRNRVNQTTPHRHVLLLHQYFKPDDTMDVNTKEADMWQTGTPPMLTELNKAKNVRRFEQRLYAWFKESFSDLKVIVSEYGADGRIGRDPNSLHAPLGWKKFAQWQDKPDGCQPYLTSLLQLESDNQDYRDVIEGYCLFGLGMNAPEQFWSYRIDAGPSPDQTKQHEDEKFSIVKGLGEERPYLILKNTARLFTGPDESYHQAAIGYAPNRSKDDEYPVVGRAPGWWQIIYHDDWRSPVWVKNDEIENTSGVKDLVCTTRPWVGGKKDEPDFQGHYEARLETDDSNDQVRYTLMVAHTTLDRMTRALPSSFALGAGFRPATAQSFEAQATVINSAGHASKQKLTVTVGADGVARVVWKDRAPTAAAAVQYYAHATWPQASLTASGPQATRNGQVSFPIPLRTGPGTGCQPLEEEYLAADDAQGYAILGKDAAIANWWQINFRGLPCWVHKDMVRTHGDMAGVPRVLAAGTAEPVHARTRQLTEAVVRAHGDAAAAEIGRLAPGGGTRVGLTGLRRASPTCRQRAAAAVKGDRDRGAESVDRNGFLRWRPTRPP